jgi:hypothetical protein
MEEKGPSRLFRVLQILIPLTSVAVAITGVLLTVASRKKEVTCTLVNSTRLVSENLGGIHPDIHVEFHGQSIVSLSKMTFSFRNTGSAAIMSKDVIEPVRLVFPATAKLMTASVERTVPADLKFSARAVPDGGDVILDFPLLNRGDEAFFSVYVFNSEAQRPTLEGRIVDVPQLVYVEANAPTSGQGFWPLQSHATRSVVRWVLITIYGSLALLFLGIWVSAVGSYLSYLPWRRKWKGPYDEVFGELAVSDDRNKQPEAEAGGQPDQARNANEVLPPFVGLSPEMHHKMLLGPHPLLVKELKKRGIPPHPHPMVESFGGLAGLSVLMLSLASFCSITGLIVYRALGG